MLKNVGHSDSQSLQHRLAAAADRFNEFLKRFSAAAERSRAGVRRYVALASHHRDMTAANEAARRAHVRSLLASGQVTERHRDTTSGWDVETIRGLYPFELLALFSGSQACPLSTAPKKGRGKAKTPSREIVGACCPIDLEQQLAAAALRAADWQDRIGTAANKGEREVLREERRQLAERGTHEEGMVHVWFRVPKAARDGHPHPARLDWTELCKLPMRDRISLAYARLTGLRDSVSLNPVIDWPVPGSIAHTDHFTRWVDCDALRPVVDGLVGDVLPRLDPRKLPPDLAEKFLDLVEEDLRQTLPPMEVLKLIASRESWPLDELPTTVGVEALRILDDDEYIGVQPRARDGGMPEGWIWGWVSPNRFRDAVGNWDEIFAHMNRPGMPAPAVQATGKGKAGAVEDSLAVYSIVRRWRIDSHSVQRAGYRELDHILRREPHVRSDT